MSRAVCHSIVTVVVLTGERVNHLSERGSDNACKGSSYKAREKAIQVVLRYVMAARGMASGESWEPGGGQI